MPTLSALISTDLGRYRPIKCPANWASRSSRSLIDNSPSCAHDLPGASVHRLPVEYSLEPGGDARILVSQLTWIDTGHLLLTMDVVLTSSISAAESQHVPFDSLHMNTESTPQRRQMRYTSPDLLTPRSPRRMAETSTALVRASPNSDEGYSAMAHTSPTTPPFSAGHVDREAEPTGSDILLEVNSQNHDRMETDMETDDSESDHQPHHGPEILEAPAAAAAQDIDGEIMDMTPDSPTAADLHPQLDAGNVIYGNLAVGRKSLR